MMKCRVCGGHTTHYGNIDFNKCGNNSLPPSGKKMEYVQCISCQLIMIPEMIEWSVEQFRQEVYNDDYGLVDTGINGSRAKEDAKWFSQQRLEEQFNVDRENLAVLDYGAGMNHFVNNLRHLGYLNARGWDPFWQPQRTTPEPLEGSYDVITSFEVFEHVPNPIESIKDLSKFLKPTGMILFTTVVNDLIPFHGKLDYWYHTPRGGHIIMHSTKSLNKTLNSAGLKLVQSNGMQHVAVWDDTND